MVERKIELSKKEKELSNKITVAQTRLAEINVLKTHIVNYSKTRDVYDAYRKSGYSKKFLADHEADIIIHRAAKKAFDELGLKKLPTVKSLQMEFAKLLTEKKDAYAELKKYVTSFETFPYTRQTTRNFVTLRNGKRIKKKSTVVVNCTPFVRQYDILDNKWGVLLCQKECQTKSIRQNSRSW